MIPNVTQLTIKAEQDHISVQLDVTYLDKVIDIRKVLPKDEQGRRIPDLAPEYYTVTKYLVRDNKTGLIFTIYVNQILTINYEDKLINK